MKERPKASKTPRYTVKHYKKSKSHTAPICSSKREIKTVFTSALEVLIGHCNAETWNNENI